MQWIPLPRKVVNQFRLLKLFASVMIACILLSMNYSVKIPTYQKSLRMVKKHENGEFLCLFTTIKPSENKMKIYENLLHNCKTLVYYRRQVRCILYDTTLSAINRNDTVESSSYKGETQRTPVVEKFYSRAQIVGWTVVNLPRVSPYEGLPYIKDMYLETAKRFPRCTFSAYFNADIVFGDGLMSTLVEAERVAELLNDTMLLIGKRTQVSIRGLSGRLFTPHEVDRIAVGNPMLTGEYVDFFFIYKHRYPWHAVPDLVIGRVAFDVFIVAKAYELKINVIDMTKTVAGVHQSIGGEYEERHGRTHPWVNIAKIDPYNYMAGFIDYAPYFSEKDRNSMKVNVYRRCENGCTSCWARSQTNDSNCLLDDYIPVLVE